MTPPAVTRATRLTPAGRGAISTVLVDGPQATTIVDRLFVAANGRPLAEQAIDRIVFGRFQGGEELIVCRRGPQRIEVHCHGGHAAADAVLQALAEQGAAVESWQASVQQDAGDRLAAEAWEALAAVQTQRAALILLDQFHGALRRELEATAQAAVDGDAAGALARIDALLGRWHLGRHLVRPFRVVLAGRPNVGKSSVVNRLLGYGRAITSPIPGTTRDVVTAITAFDGWPVELADTAGLHATSSELESLGIARAMEEIRRADLVIFVHAAAAGLDSATEALAQECTASNAMVVLNKADLVPLAERLTPTERYVSALTGEGFDHLVGAMGRRLAGEVPPAGSGVPFLERHVLALQQARHLLAADAGKPAEDWLAALLGS